VNCADAREWRRHVGRCLVVHRVALCLRGRDAAGGGVAVIVQLAIFSATNLLLAYMGWRAGAKYGRVRGFVDGWWAYHEKGNGRALSVPEIPGA